MTEASREEKKEIIFGKITPKKEKNVRKLLKCCIFCDTTFLKNPQTLIFQGFGGFSVTIVLLTLTHFGVLQAFYGCKLFHLLGFAKKDKTGYCLFIENGSPKLAAAATIAHELTHIWQYINWNDNELAKKYGKKNMLEIYEGMAKWAEIQYLLLINEKS